MKITKQYLTIQAACLFPEKITLFFKDFPTDG